MSKKEDAAELAARIINMDGPYSLKKLVGETDNWSEDRVKEAIAILEDGGGITFMGKTKKHFSANAEILSGFVKKSEEKATKIKVPKIQVPGKRKFPSIDEILKTLSDVNAPKTYTGDARDAKIAELFDLACSKISEINSAIGVIAQKFPMYVDESKDIISIIRIVPESPTAPGGVRVTYNPPPSRRRVVLFEAAWPAILTDENGTRIVMNIEGKAVSMLQRMTNYVIKHSSN